MPHVFSSYPYFSPQSQPYQEVKKSQKNNFLKNRSLSSTDWNGELNFSLTTWAPRLMKATKSQQLSPWFSPQNQLLAKNRGFVTWRIKFTKNRLVILSKFLKAKNSFLGSNNQQKILLKRLRDVGPKIKKNSMKNIFYSFAREHPELLVLKTIMRWCSEIFSKKNHLKCVLDQDFLTGILTRI